MDDSLRALAAQLEAQVPPDLPSQVRSELSDLSRQLSSLPELTDLQSLPGSTDLAAKLMYYEALCRGDPAFAGHGVLSSSAWLEGRVLAFCNFVRRLEREAEVCGPGDGAALGRRASLLAAAVAARGC
jgi:hypothetical protein